ncbi:MAG: 4Fe-4S dicluster domain-containing protein [Lachnospiraceae bacterium]|nr:4Fe-4S dicluster domain-containing protein [Lachnospiraceae bacterium]MBQ9607147.1 4Fe-4S dicluster domain-containing protein [Lachnospiraceae bacterium]
MSLANFTKTELKNLFRKPATEKYPDGPATYKDTTRGHIENNMDTCVLCSVCQMRCPTGAITVDRKAQTWSIRPFSCIQCRRCVDNCPKKSLSMAKEYTKPDVVKSQMDFELSDRQKAVLAEQARQAAERVAAAMEERKKAAASAKQTKDGEAKKSEDNKTQ